MVAIKTFRNGKLVIKGNDHNPPHFHVQGPEGNAMVSIETLDVIAGSTNKKLLGFAIEWASDRRDMLKEKFYQLNPNLRS